MSTIKQFLLNILVDPLSKTALTLDNASNSLINENTSFTILDNVPIIILQNKAKKLENKSALHNEMKTDFDYVEHYNKDAEFFNYFKDDQYSTTKNERERSRQSIKKAVPSNTKLLLDVGCGGAWVAEYFTAKNTQVISLDVSTKNPILALQKVNNVNHAAVVADVFHLPFASNTFDTIIASEVIEHLIDPKLFVTKLLDVLKPNGKLILMTPYNEKIVYNMCVHCNHPTPSYAHLHSFNEKNIGNYFPEKNISFKTTAFSNRYFTKLKIYDLLKFLPFNFWFGLDKIVNTIFKKQVLFLIEITKF
jgi:2-polyprenyl-3-methyl-5-hydroxy-6-metoxy-1,4-benzoquinol methylase